jgi:hypothetical protein
MKFLVPIFKTCNVLFIGYSLRDFEVLQAVSKARIQLSNENKAPKTHYLLEAKHRENAVLLDVKEKIYADNYGIKMIPYSAEDKGFDSLFDEMNNINGVLKKIDTPEDKNAGEDTSHAE